MEPEIVKTGDFVEEKLKVEVKLEKAEEADSKLSTEQWLLIGYRISAFVDELPSYFTYFFDAYKQPLVIIGLILLTLVIVKLMLALLDALNGIPLLAPLLELIGLAYTTWFVYRYLISTDSRQELFEEIKRLKEYVLGR
jgi:hypothetical protein